MNAPQVLERCFLESRSKLLDLAATFDRLDRAEGSVADDPRRAKLDAALRLLLDGQADRAERLQVLFSRPYDPEWAAGFAPMEARR
jgi:hypothetical protein